MGNIASNILRLKDSPVKQLGVAHFTVDSYDKQRAAGKLFDPFTIQYITDDDKTEWDVTGASADRLNNIMTDIANDHLTSKQLAEKYNISVQAVGQWEKKAKVKGWLNDKGKITQLPGAMLLKISSFQCCVKVNRALGYTQTGEIHNIRAFNPPISLC